MTTILKGNIISAPSPGRLDVTEHGYLDVYKRQELGTALFVVSSTLILKFGIATVALVGSALLIRGEIDIPLFFMFLLVASRLYAPLEGCLLYTSSCFWMVKNALR